MRKCIHILKRKHHLPTMLLLFADKYIKQMLYCALLCVNIYSEDERKPVYKSGMNSVPRSVAELCNLGFYNLRVDDSSSAKRTLWYLDRLRTHSRRTRIFRTSRSWKSLWNNLNTNVINHQDTRSARFIPESSQVQQFWIPTFDVMRLSDVSFFQI